MIVRLLGIAAAVSKPASACCAAVHDWLQKHSPGHTPIVVRCSCIPRPCYIVIWCQRHTASNDSKDPPEHRHDVCISSGQDKKHVTVILSGQVIDGRNTHPDN